MVWSILHVQCWTGICFRRSRRHVPVQHVSSLSCSSVSGWWYASDAVGGIPPSRHSSSPMHNILTLLSPSSALPGLLSLAYTAESQLDRFERLLNSGSLAGSTQALDRIHSHLKQQSATSLALLDNMELCDTPLSIPTFKSTLARFGIDVRSAGKSDFWRVVEAAARSGSVRRWDTRLQIEAFEATRRRWFLVFDTITYDPSQFGDEVMFGPYWRRYQRSVQHAVVRRAHGSLRRFRRSGMGFDDHVRYFAVPEAHKDGRTHVHILWFVSHLPDVASEADPNAHGPLRPRRQVDGWPPYPFGLITMRIPVRYRGDAFTTRLGWRLPLDKDGKRPILKDAVAVARYMAKYLSKPKPESLKCRRIRTSPRLGLRPLQARLSTLTLPQLALLSRDPRQSRIKRAINGIPLPQSLLRSQILREMIIRFRKHLMLYSGPMRIMFDTLKSVLGTNSRPPLQEHFPSLTLLATMSKLRSFIDTLMNTLSDTDISELSSLFTEYDKPSYFAGHAPTYRPSLGVL